LDDVHGLQPRQHESPWIIEKPFVLATRIPCRQAAYLPGDFLEEEIDHRSLYRWGQKAGAETVDEEDEMQSAVFGRSEDPLRNLK
jgi:hypothetical protein